MVQLDLIDRKIIHQLDLNARMPVSAIAKRLRQSREKVNYRINRLVEEGVIRKFVCMINPPRFGYSVFKLFIKFQNLSRELEDEAIAWLARNDHIYWIASARGRWDVNLTIFARDITHFEEIMAGFYTRFGPHIQEQEFNTTVQVGILSKDWILPSAPRHSNAILFGGKPQDLHLDKLDVELLRILANNARMSAMALARRLKTTQRIIIYRIRLLEDRGVILGYTTSLNLEVLGKQFFKSILHFNVMDQHLKAKLTEFYRSEPSIGFFVFCVGGWPTEVELIVGDNAEYFRVMDKLRETFPELKGYETIIFPKEHKFDWMPLCYSAQGM